MTLLKNPNFLILDEPSNDFDINTLHVMEEFLQDFPGTLLLVSHDRFLLDKLADHVLVFEGEGVISDFPGNYTQWKWAQEEKTEQKAREKEEAQKKAAKSAPASPTPKSDGKLTFKEKQELDQLEPELEALELEKQRMEEQLSSGRLTDHVQIQQLARDLEQLSEAIDAKTMRWLELSEKQG
jgi:ABC transport system ATP-binding/permease protein